MGLFHLQAPIRNFRTTHLKSLFRNRRKNCFSREELSYSYNSIKFMRSFFCRAIWASPIIHLRIIHRTLLVIHHTFIHHTSSSEPLPKTLISISCLFHSSRISFNKIAKKSRIINFLVKQHSPTFSPLFL